MLSLRRRLILGHLATVIVIVTCTALAGWWQLSRSVQGQLDAALLALAETEVSMQSENAGGSIHVHDAPAGSAPPSLIRLDRLVQIVDADGRVLARSVNLGAGTLPAPRSLLDRLNAGETVYETLPNASEEPLRMVSVPTLVRGRKLAIQVAGSLDDVDHTLQSAAILFTGMTLTLLLAVGYAGLALTRGTFRAIDEIIDKARLIGETNLNQRLPHPGTSDEIGHLVDILNAMLDRLEFAFDSQRRFTADASHELRSPLSRLRTEIEVTLRRPREAQDYVDALRSCRDEVLRLTSLVEELLMLARLDAGEKRDPAEAVSAAVLVQDTIRRMLPLAQERQINLVFDAATAEPIAVARAATSLALTNLIDNAVKFSPTGGTVVVNLTTDEENVAISVQDQGPGIAAEDLPYLFDRFFRGAAARAATQGVGLGLSLSQTLVRAYGGRITVETNHSGGAKFTMSLPRAG